MRSKAHLAALSVLLAALITACPGADPPGAAAPPPAAKGFAYGPYMQNVTPGSLTLIWFAREGGSASGQVSLRGPNGKLRTAKATVSGPAGRAVFAQGLAADTQYTYEVTLADGTAARGQAGTAPQKPRPFRFIAYGDTRTHVKIHAYLLGRMLARKPAFILHTGDFPEHAESWAEWRTQVLDVMAGAMRRLPIYPVIGNHELIFPPDGPPVLSEHYGRVFDVPDTPGAQDRWYQFRWGGATFFIVDHYSPFAKGSAQYKWLDAALGACKTHWRFVSHHEPPFSSSRRNGSVSARLALVPLFEKHKVTAVFNGHDHGYSRSLKAGVNYFVTAGGGAPLYPVNVTENPHQKFARSCHNYVVLDVSEKHVQATTYDIFDKAIDKVTTPAPK
jgi:hypothetical protein